MSHTNALTQSVSKLYPTLPEPREDPSARPGFRSKPGLRLGVCQSNWLLAASPQRVRKARKGRSGAANKARQGEREENASLSESRA